MAWAPKPRPEWVEELNAFGRRLGGPGALVPLDEASLVHAATVAAGGLDDFGGDEFRKPFAVFVRSLEGEADLNLVGRLMARNEIVRSLRNRLQITHAHRAHPEIAAGAVTAPVLVTGTGRSGTSILHELLARDPAHRVLLTWEALHPWPPPEAATYRTDPRIAAAHREYATFWNLVTPEYQTMHENGGDVPNEDALLVMPAFLSDHFMGSYTVPSYTDFLVGADMRRALAFHRAFLQVLQWRCPADRWVLKWPGFLSRLADFFGEYPDARVVITHRDPLKVLPSMTSLMATLVWQHSDSVDVAGIVKRVTRGTAMVFDLIDQMRADHTLPDDQIVDVRYVDLVEEPWPTLRRVYDELGLELTERAEERMREYLAAKPKDRHGAHRYSFADTGLDVDDTRALFAAYQARHDVPSEV